MSDLLPSALQAPPAFSVWHTLALYRLHWSVENMHQTLKGRGIDLEATRLTKGTRMSLLFGVVSLAFVWCCLSGDFVATKSPPKTLKHSFPQKVSFDWASMLFRAHCQVGPRKIMRLDCHCSDF
ncbi:hypothetical protein [Deinococcus sp. QL22]|uniref:hypothetical protein n=1 Tax=Deinococcus sp. QL22 TaxID=2939437 RepID=UPI002017F0FF|nr:hypothetical protein [Deinococcus sp. QL22]UQN10598.1 hypothetical protein M1R55_30860 [Deinococcus sp. QL22]